jgi:phenylacetate-CoA ligase
VTATREDRAGELIELVLERNPFQRARVASLGLGSQPELADLPPLEKQELVQDQQRRPPFGTNLTHPLERYTHLHQTSGTTGPPLRVLDTADDWAWWRSLFAAMLSVTGVGPGDRVALAFSFGPHVQFWAAKDGLQEVGAMAIPLGGMTSVQRLRTIAEVEATALMCTPTYALRLIEVAKEERLEQAVESVQRVICTGEPGASLPGVRLRIEAGLGARCYDHAGLTEAGPFGYPCTAGGGLHVHDDEFVCEILDTALRPVEPGERGELVLTPLRRTGFPVLRYRTGDVVVRTEQGCPAGHGDRWLPAGEFRITFYSERSGMDEVKLEVELPAGSQARGLQELMRQQLGLRVRVVPVTPGVLPRPGGKARRVVDERAARGGAV